MELDVSESAKLSLGRNGRVSKGLDVDVGDIADVDKRGDDFE